MPPLPDDSATLDEVLEVRGEPLTEEELWAVLLESCLALGKHLIKGKWIRAQFKCWTLVNNIGFAISNQNDERVSTRHLIDFF